MSTEDAGFSVGTMDNGGGAYTMNLTSFSLTTKAMNDDQSDMNDVKIGGSWTTGGDENIIFQKKIDHGAHGFVLEVLYPMTL